MLCLRVGVDSSFPAAGTEEGWLPGRPQKEGNSRVGREAKQGALSAPAMIPGMGTDLSSITQQLCDPE